MVAWILEGAPITLGRNGSAARATMLRCPVSRSDLEEALRQASAGEESGTSGITLEPSGKITILKALAERLPCTQPRTLPRLLGTSKGEAACPESWW